MAGWSQVIVIGNVGRDPEMRTLPSGIFVCSFTVAVSKKWTDRNSNEQKEKTTWVRVSCWRQLAETVHAYVHKGMQVMVVGEVEQPQAYLDKSGQPAASFELTASNVQFFGNRGDGQGGSGNYGDDQGSSGSSSVDDIPF